MSKGLWNASLVLLILGALTAAAGEILLWRYKKQRWHKTTVWARVVDLVLGAEEGDVQSGTFKNKYYPVFEFYANGQLYKLQHSEGAYPSAFSMGDRVRLSLHEDRPEEYEIVTDHREETYGKLLLAAGSCLAVLGMIFFFRYALRH